MRDLYGNTRWEYLAAMPDHLSENPSGDRGVLLHDVLSALLATIRITGALQFCFMPTGHWQTDAAPSLAAMATAGTGGTIPFHIVVEGSCWLKIEGTEAQLEAGDVVMFPFGTGHQLGAGRDGQSVTPTGDLPPKPWREIPILRYGDGPDGVRLLCGYLSCDAMAFAPFSQALPKLVHVRTRIHDGVGSLDATIRQMVAEVDHPRSGSVAMVQRLTEIIFIEALRHQITMDAPRATGWLAALADPQISRCLSVIHDDPQHDWSLEALADAARISRSAFAERFKAILGTSPVQYVREWRLYLACISLRTTRRTDCRHRPRGRLRQRSLIQPGLFASSWHPTGDMARFGAELKGWLAARGGGVRERKLQGRRSMAKFTLFGAGAMMLVIGALNLFAPQMMMDAPQIKLTSANHFHVIRAAYGGAYLGIAALFLLGLFRAEHLRTSLLSVVLLFSGFASGRITSILMDGLPIALYLAVLAFEITFATLAVIALRRTA